MIGDIVRINDQPSTSLWVQGHTRGDGLVYIVKLAGGGYKRKDVRPAHLILIHRPTFVDKSLTLDGRACIVLADDGGATVRVRFTTPHVDELSHGAKVAWPDLEAD